MKSACVTCFLAIVLVGQASYLRGFAKNSVPFCGSGNSEPFAAQSDGRNRPCEPGGQRRYKPRHKGIGFEILDSESEACFVPDQAYQLLDELIDTTLARIRYDPASTSPYDQAMAISMVISDVLREKGFSLFIDTETLSDALVNRNASGDALRRIFDCDTGSLIFLTMAENLGASVAMVEMPLPHSKNHHNFVRWLQGDTTVLEWDLNLRSECKVPPGLTGFEGHSMSREEAASYALSLRPNLWSRVKNYDRSLMDFHTSMVAYEGSDVYNNLAWLIATREVSNRTLLKDEALAAARRAVSSWPTANYKDTLACVYAFRGEFSVAIDTENEALEETFGEDYERHLKFFQHAPAKDCTGE